MTRCASLLLPVVLCGAAMAQRVEPTGPIAVLDTGMGRVTCRLYQRQAPALTANFVGLATGAKDWKDQATGDVVHRTPFYDGTAAIGVVDGFGGGDRLGARRGVAGDPQPLEQTGLKFDRAGRLAMSIVQGKVSSSIFFVTDHADSEIDRGKRGVVFGQCEEASLPVVAAISHALLSTDNHPKEPVALDRIAIIAAGQPLPAVAAHVDAGKVVPQPVPVGFSMVPAPEPTGPTAVIDTSQGTMTCRLFTETPLATANFTGLANGTKPWHDAQTRATAQGHFYDGLHVDRVLPDFMVQNGDHPHQGFVGTDHGIGIAFGVETVPGLNFDRPGRLAMANDGPNTNASEWFVTTVPVAALNEQYTIFGQCDVATVDVARKIAALPRDHKNKPLTPVVISSVRVGR